jgi:hypothetical protein
MVAHLGRTAARIKQRVALTPGDVILDIGSNDGTFLAALMEPGVTAVGVDPTAEKFRKYYRPEIQVIPELFSAASFRRHTSDKKVFPEHGRGGGRPSRDRRARILVTLYEVKSSRSQIDQPR